MINPKLSEMQFLCRTLSATTDAHWQAVTEHLCQPCDTNQYVAQDSRVTVFVLTKSSKQDGDVFRYVYSFIPS